MNSHGATVREPPMGALLAETKLRVKCLPERWGLGHHYFYGWWSAYGRSKPMITAWNRQYAAIFVHVPKTAGTSIAEMFQMERAPDYHAPACAFRAADPATFDRAYKFAVVRNPWDRLVSAYHYTRHSSPYERDRIWSARHLEGFRDFGDFVRALKSARFRSLALQQYVFMPQSYFLCAPSGALQVDALTPFETLAAGLGAAAARIGVTLRPSRVNQSPHEAYEGYYDDETRRIVARVYRRDVETFGYSFGGPATAAAVLRP